jgi:predicted dehydrogenase
VGARARRAGIIGCGWVAEQGHLPALARMPEVEVVAIADPDPARARSMGEAFGIARRHSTHLELLEDPSIEVVGVCVPVESHAEVATAAVEAGKHVLLEKPPALDLDQWERIAAATEAAGVTLMVGLNMRWHTSFRSVRDLVRSGRLGRVQCVRTLIANDVDKRPVPPQWRSHRSRGGGALMEMGVHHLDLWRFVLDAEIEEVSAIARGDDDSLAVAGRMQGGVPVSSLFSQRTGQLNEIEVHGDRGHVRASPYTAARHFPNSGDPWSIRARAADVRATTSPSHLLRERRAGGFYVSSFVAEWRHFLAAVDGARAPEVGIDSARRLMQAVLATAASASDGRLVACLDAPRTLAPSPRSLGLGPGAGPLGSEHRRVPTDHSRPAGER